MEFGRSELAVTMGTSSVLHQLSSPILDQHHHTLGVERPLSLGSHFYSTHLVHRARWGQRWLLPGQSRCYKTKPEKQIVSQIDTCVSDTQSSYLNLPFTDVPASITTPAHTHTRTHASTYTHIHRHFLFFGFRPYIE